MKQFSTFLVRHWYAILVKIWKWSKLLNFVLFIKKQHLNHVYNRFWSALLTFAFLHSRKANFQMSQFSEFLLRRGYAILVKIWKWPKLLNSVPFSKNTHVNHVHSRIRLVWITFAFYSQWRQTSKWVLVSRFLLRPGYAIFVKICKWSKLLNFVPFIKKTQVNDVYNRIFVIVTDFCSFSVNEDKLQNESIFKISAIYAI